MISNSHFTKRRYVWQPRAWRLLRERMCVTYARQVIPSNVDGVEIVFSPTTLQLGRRLVVITHALNGRPLIEMLYDPAQQAVAVKMGVLALDAWQQAAIVGHPFPFFSLTFRLVKGLGTLVQLQRNSMLLSKKERREFSRLVASYILAHDAHPTLVHGDLHASHVLVNLEHQSLGFIDLEAVHVGKPATDFAQLWIGYHHAAPALGQSFYQAYAARFPDLMNDQFDSDIRTEIAIRCYRHVRDGISTGNQALESKGRRMLAAALSGTSFAMTYLSGRFD